MNDPIIAMKAAALFVKNGLGKKINDFKDQSEANKAITQVIGGNRYTIGSFWDNEEAEYSEEKMAEWEKEISEERLRQAEQIKGWQDKKAEGIILDPSTY